MFFLDSYEEAKEYSEFCSEYSDSENERAIKSEKEKRRNNVVGGYDFDLRQEVRV